MKLFRTLIIKAWLPKVETKLDYFIKEIVNDHEKEYSKGVQNLNNTYGYTELKLDQIWNHIDDKKRERIVYMPSQLNLKLFALLLTVSRPSHKRKRWLLVIVLFAYCKNPISDSNMFIIKEISNSPLLPVYIY